MSEVVEYGRLLPTGIELSDYTFTESINQPVADGTVTSTIPSLDVSTAKTGIFYATKEYELKSPFGKFKGIATSTSDSNGMRVYKQTPESMSILSAVYTLNRIRSVPPFKGTLTAYFDLLAQLVGFEGRRIIQWNNKDTICEMGYFGNVYENFVALITALKFDINFFYDNVIVGPSRRIELDNHILKGLPDIQYQDGVDNRWIKTHYYVTEWHDNFQCYPFLSSEEEENPGQIWLPALDINTPNVLSVDNIGMGTGAYVEQDLDLTGSLLEVNQPPCSLPPCMRLTASGITSVYGFLGSWTQLGIEVAQTPLASDLTNPNKPFINGKAGQYVLVQENNVEYYCTVSGEVESNFIGEGTTSDMNALSADSLPSNSVFNNTTTNTQWTVTVDPLYKGYMTYDQFGALPNKVDGIYANCTDYGTAWRYRESGGELPIVYWEQISDHYVSGLAFVNTGQPLIPWRGQAAQWVQWGQYNGQSFNSQDNINAYIKANPDMGGTDGFYTVIGANGFPIMPSLWLSSGGKLEVEINPDTKSVKVKLWGADVPLNKPVYQTPPTSSTGYVEGDIVGFDNAARPTKNTLWYILKNGVWEYDSGIESFPYAPYKIAVSAGDTDYDGLYITGKGVKFEKDDITFETGRWDDDDNATAQDSLTAEIDNQYIHSAQRALDVAEDYDAYSNGASFTFSADCSIPTEYDFIGVRRGSWDDVIDYMLYYGYDMGISDSRAEVDDWWKQHLNNPDFTRADIDDAIMKDTEHHVSMNMLGRIGGCRIMAPNRGVFRITEATLVPTNLSISGYHDTRFGDLDNLVTKFNKSLTLGDLDDLFAEIQAVERLGDWTLGLRNQEPARLVV
jgi:hypothetical protein